MTATTKRVSFYSLSPAEKRAWSDAAEERVRAASRAIVAEMKARKPDPHEGEYLAWRAMGLVCILVVKHRNGAASFEISRDGAGARVYLPTSKAIRLPESEDDFLLALIPRSFVKWICTKDPAAGSRFRDLFGVTLPLAADRVWTDAQCETWTRLDRRRASINVKIQTAKSRRKYSTIKRRDAA